MLAVGTAVAGGPPRRSQRAGLPHWAPPLGASVETGGRPGMCDLERGKPSVSQTLHPRPRHSRALATTPKRSAPEPHDFGAEGVQRPLIAWHAVIVGVPTQDAGQPAALFGNGPIAALEKLAPQGVQLRPRPLRVGDPLELETPPPVLPADVREAQEPERLRLAESPLLTLLGGKPPEPDQPRLLGVQLQRELREPVAKI